MSDIILKTTDLTKKYHNKAVVDNLNIEIRKGEILKKAIDESMEYF